MSIFTIIAIILFALGSLVALNGLFNESDRLPNFDSGSQEFIFGLVAIIVAGIFRFIGKSRKPKYVRQH